MGQWDKGSRQKGQYQLHLKMLNKAAFLQDNI